MENSTVSHDGESGIALQLARTFVLKNGEISRYRTLVDISPLPMFVRTLEGACLLSNLAYQRMLGRSAEGVLGFGWRDSLAEEDRDRAIQQWVEATRSGSDFVYRTTYTIQPDGLIFKAVVKATKIPGDVYAGFCMPDDRVIVERFRHCDETGCVLKNFFYKSVLGLQDPAS